MTVDLAADYRVRVAATLLFTFYRNLYFTRTTETNLLSTNVNAAPTLKLFMHHADVCEGKKLKYIIMGLTTQIFVEIV
jgi:hypothetical protein